MRNNDDLMNLIKLLSNPKPGTYDDFMKCKNKIRNDLTLLELFKKYFMPFVWSNGQGSYYISCGLGSIKDQQITLKEYREFKRTYGK